MCEILDVLTEAEIVHADLKPDNILIRTDGMKITDFKLIDFGSAFDFSTSLNAALSTPEYMPPEVLSTCGLGLGVGGGIPSIKDGKNQIMKSMPWSYDMWSLGSLLLEMASGFPIWLSLKGRVES